MIVLSLDQPVCTGFFNLRFNTLSKGKRHLDLYYVHTTGKKK